MEQPRIDTNECVPGGIHTHTTSVWGEKTSVGSEVPGIETISTVQLYDRWQPNSDRDAVCMKQEALLKSSEFET